MYTTVNLRLFRKRNSLTQDEVALFLGTSKGFISQVENGRVKLPEDKVYRILDNDRGWNLDGFVKESVVSAKPEAPADGPHTVPLLPIFAQAGHLTGWSEGIAEVECERVISPVGNIDMAVHIYGESMYPDIPNGSVVYVKKVKVILEWGRAYILDTVDGPLLKYLTPGTDDEHIRCLSANHDPMYAPFEVSKDNILGIYKVIMCMSMK